MELITFSIFFGFSLALFTLSKVLDRAIPAILGAVVLMFMSLDVFNNGIYREYVYYVENTNTWETLQVPVLQEYSQLLSIFLLLFTSVQVFIAYDILRR